MPNKDARQHNLDLTQHGAAVKIASVTPKATMSKTAAKELTMSPGASSTVPPLPAVEEQRPELLGSVTTLQQQRTSARVIKKLKLEPPADKRDARTQPLFVETTECETPNKTEDKEPKFPTVKQRMPKALWSADEKSLFFEALNEYGKEFDAITAYICAKMKRKGMPDANLKTKTQVSHFYYRTWHKLAKHVTFDENVKKVAQELYALINYGELRRKLVSVNEKTCARLGEMVRCGSMAVRARGKTLRVRTPMCRALRRLNQITERAMGARVCSRCTVGLRARDAAAWARVQAAAHNPRAALALPPRTRLAALLRALQARWTARAGHAHTNRKSVSLENGFDVGPLHEAVADESPERRAETKDDDHDNHLGLEPDRSVVQASHQSKKLALHVGPRPGVEIHLPVLSPSEQLSSQKICFSSYLERMSSKRDKDGSGVKIRTPKRQRKDSVTDKDGESKKFKLDDTDHKLMNIDETAVDGIELMASYRGVLHEDEEKPSTEDEKEAKADEAAEDEAERDKDMTERDKDMSERDKDMSERDKDMSERDKDMSEREKDSFSEMEDDEKYNKSDTDNESDGKGDKTAKERKFKNLKVKFRIRPKKRGGSVYTLVLEPKEEAKAEVGEAKAEVGELKTEEEPKPEFDVDTALRQVRRGWSLYDAGDLTVGDLYLMFGARSKLELDYWWAEPTPPLPQPQKIPKPAELDRPPERDRPTDRREKADRTPDKGADSSVEDEKEKRERESDTDIFSPKNTFSQDSNDGMSGDERKSEQLASPDHKASGTLKLVSKLINRPVAPPPPDGFSLLSDRLKRLLALAGNAHVAAGGAGAGAGGVASRCKCGHVCAQKKGPPPDKKQPTGAAQGGPAGETPLFRPPPPIAPRTQSLEERALSLEGLPRRRRGRPRASDRRVVVQRLLPLLPKLPPAKTVPLKVVPTATPSPVRILPKPPPTSASDMSCVYVVSECDGVFYFHDGDRKIPINAFADLSDDANDQDDDEEDDMKDDVKEVKMDVSSTEVSRAKERPESNPDTSAVNPKIESQGDIASFLPTESLSLSPSRLLRETEGWMACAHDFSLSSFLNTLDVRQPDADRAADLHAPAPHHDPPRLDQPDHTVDSQLQSLMAESSVDYVAKFADLAAEVTDETNPLAE